MQQVQIRAVGRKQFWSAGRKWTDDGTVVSIVEDETLPRKFLRGKIDRTGFLVVVMPEGSQDEVPLIDARRVRPFWKADKLFVRNPDGPKDGAPIEVQTEMDFPAMDSDFQAWVVQNRKDKDAAGQITRSDFAQVRADHRFLAVEFPDLAVLDEPAPKPQPQQQGKR